MIPKSVASVFMSAHVFMRKCKFPKPMTECLVQKIVDEERSYLIRWAVV
jgi:hypothetical protein